MRTYAKHLAFVRSEIDRLGGSPLGLSFRSLVEGLGPLATGEADDACRVFALTLEWPPLSEQTRWEVLCRLACAEEWLECCGCDEVPEEESGSTLLDELLIDYWRDVGQMTWIETKIVSRHRIGGGEVS